MKYTSNKVVAVVVGPTDDTCHTQYIHIMNKQRDDPAAAEHLAVHDDENELNSTNGYLVISDYYNATAADYMLANKPNDINNNNNGFGYSQGQGQDHQGHEHDHSDHSPNDLIHLIDINRHTNLGLSLNRFV